ncbi:MAG: cobalamin B12-binding domain-containing protein, partial [Thermacetogeniaceae bacterium]
VEAIKETGARIVGVCVLLTFCIGYVKELVDLLEETGLREKVTVVVGGYPVDEQVKEFTGVDYVSNDGVIAMEIFERIAEDLKENGKI